MLVVGGGQSALESAALLHESGARARWPCAQDHMNWLHGGKYQRLLGRRRRLVYAPTDVGPDGPIPAGRGARPVPAAAAGGPGPARVPGDPPGWRRLAARRGCPRYRSRWAVPWFPRPRGRASVAVKFADGDTQIVDHLLFGTGYRVDITRYPFLTAALAARIERAEGYPLLGPGMESSVPGLHFLGAPAAWSFGPIMRFVSGGWYTGQRARADHRRPGPASPERPSRRPCRLRPEGRRDPEPVGGLPPG